MSQPPNQPYPGQPGSGQPYPGQPTPGQPYPGQPATGQPYPGQPYPGQAALGQPYSGPAYPGQPNPDVPSSVPPQPGYPAQPGYPEQPGYGPQPSYPQPEYNQPEYTQLDYQQAGYQQAGYPQPGYPQAGPPTQGYPPAPTKSKALPITLVSIALVLVVCVGGGVAVYLAGRNVADGITNTGGTLPRPTTSTERSTPPPATISVVEPKTLAGRPKVTDKTYTAAVEQLKDNLVRLPGATDSVAAVYGRPAKRDLVLVVAAASPIADPKGELDRAFDGPTTADLKLTGVSSIPAGSLGGVAKCAKGVAGGSPISLCAWADDGSSGWMIWYFASLRDAKSEFVKLRAQIEKKSN